MSNFEPNWFRRQLALTIGAKTESGRVGCLGYILLVPVGLLAWVAIKAINYSVKGGTKRLVGIIGCPLCGGLCIAVGWWLAFVGYLETKPDGVYQVTYPIAGWISIVVGALYSLVGTLWSAFGHTKWENSENEKHTS